MRWAMLFILASGLWAQPAFEVASVKASGPLKQGRPVGMRGGPGTNDPGQISWNYVTLQDVVLRAYDLKEFQVSAPSWMSSEHYDITAKVPADTGKEQFQIMLQNLLSERFHLKAHREVQQGTVYELVTGKNGPRFKASPPETAPQAPVEDTKSGQPMTLKHGADGLIELPE